MEPAHNLRCYCPDGLHACDQHTRAVSKLAALYLVHVAAAVRLLLLQAS